MAYVTLRQFAAHIKAAARPSATHPEELPRLYAPRLELLNDDDSPDLTGGVVGVYDFTESSGGWVVWLERPRLEHMMLASDREPARARNFRTFEAAWRAVNQAFELAGVKRGSVEVR